MTAALGPFIMRHAEVKNNMAQFMSQHVLPQFTSPEGYMRAIVRVVVTRSARHTDCIRFTQACEVLGTVERADITWDTEEVTAYLCSVQELELTLT